MNPQQAKEILVLYRPGTADANDPDFAEALELCRRDAELQRWLDEHCAQYAALRSRFKQLPVPDGLKQQILAERKVHTLPLHRRPAVLLAAVATVAALMGLVWSHWLSPRRDSGEDLTYTGFQNRMVSLALRGYGGMELTTDDPARIRSYFSKIHAPTNYIVPAPLQKAALAGCATTSWQGAKVSMICFSSGNPLPAGQTTDLWLFVFDRAAVAGVPPARLASVAKVSRATTASWTDGDSAYLLVADGDEEFLRKYL